MFRADVVPLVLFVFYVKTLEAATNDGPELAWDINLLTMMLLAHLKKKKKKRITL